MKTYNDIKEIKNEFMDGRFELASTFTLKGIKYKLNRSPSFTLGNAINNVSGKNRPHLIYTIGNPAAKKEAKAAGLDDWIVFMWAWNPNNLHIQPNDVKVTNEHRLTHVLVREGDEGADPRIIGDTAEVKFTGIGNSPVLKGKVDTGATLSSLHADRYKVDREAGTVTFVNKDISPNTITVPLDDHVPIRSSDGGTEYRPVIRLNVKINDMPLQDIAFNLNDRTGMDSPILLGQNILEKGRFLIDPMKEGVESEAGDPELDVSVTDEAPEMDEVMPTDDTERDLDAGDESKTAPSLEDVIELIQSLIDQRKADAESEDVE